MKDPRDTPAMRQFYRFKRQHPECVLLFRMGDFYESFDDDAVALSRTLGLTLTERTAGVPMAGVPHHQIENYIRRLIEAGFRVAIADQIQDPKDAKGVVERAVTRVMTPGTLVDEGLLTDDAVSTLAAVCFLDAGDDPDGRVAVAVADLSTGRFLIFDCRAASLVDELARRSVTEVLYAETADGAPPPRVKRIIEALGVSGGGQPSWYFRPTESREALCALYGVATLAGFGLADDDPALSAAGALVRYLQLTQTAGGEDLEKHGFRAPTLAHLAPPRREEATGECLVDATSLRSLEVVRTMRTGDTDGALLGIFSGSGRGSGRGGARTPMGKRLLREWLCRPLADLDRIRARHRAVATFVEGRATAEALGEHLARVQDVARIGGRVALRRASPRDLVALGKSLAQIRDIAEALDNAPALAAQRAAIADLIEALSPLAARIGETCIDTPPAHLRDGGLIRDGVDAELDECRLLKRDASSWLASYQKELIETHDLPSLKVGYNKVFGYYIELPAAQSRRAPDAFSRKQTLKNAERYITPALKEFEDKVTTADARAVEREQAIFNALCDAAATNLAAITRFAEAVAELDVLLAFADKAAHRGWVRPTMVEASALYIQQGRHPVLDERLEEGFVPNDLTLNCNPDDAIALAIAAAKDPNTCHRDRLCDLGASGARAVGGVGGVGGLALITGPNMAGKSTFIRQNALLVLLAHAGSFIPAERAVIGLTDRLFTRVGADDALHAGQSTFMVEMTETARILNSATPRSLVILDEIGRGTSTLDGLSLAWAIAEHLAGEHISGTGVPPVNGPRTLFATHYHELTDLETRLPGRVTNLHVAVREWADDIVFLHRILPGPTDQSYGIHVAKLAGVPRSVTARADTILKTLAVHHHAPEALDGSTEAAVASNGSPRGRGGKHIDARNIPEPGQLPLFTEYLPHPVLDRLREVKIEAMSPLEAFETLRRLAEEAG